MSSPKSCLVNLPTLRCTSRWDLKEAGCSGENAVAGMKAGKEEITVSGKRNVTKTSVSAQQHDASGLVHHSFPSRNHVFGTRLRDKLCGSGSSHK